MDILCRKGLGVQWRKWKMVCLSSASFLVIVNCGSKDWFKGQSGVRRGDPLPPFLFTLVMDDALSQMLQQGYG